MAEIYSIRLTRDDTRDKAAIGQLEIDCAQGSEVKFCFHSETPRLAKFNEMVTLMAETKTDGKIVGTFTGNIRSVQFEPNRFELVSWLCSLRVDPNHRRYGLALLLIKAMEVELVKRGVAFVYCGTWHDNEPSFRLFLKAGFTHVFSAPFQACNVASTLPILPPDSYWLKKAIFTEKLGQKEGEEFMAKHFSKSFFYPDFKRNPIKSRVYKATKTDSSDFVAFSVAEIADEWNFVWVSLKFRLYCLLLTILNFFFPLLFEKPLPLRHAWAIHWGMPFAYDVKSDPANLGPLMKATVATAVKDMAGTADVIGLSLTRQMGNIADEHVETAQKSVFLSKTVFHRAGTRFLAKSLLSDPEKAKAMETFVKKQPFWYIDGKEL